MDQNSIGIGLQGDITLSAAPPDVAVGNILTESGGNILTESGGLIVLG